MSKSTVEKNMNKVNEYHRALKSWLKAYKKAKNVKEKDAARHNVLEVLKIYEKEIIKYLIEYV